MSLVGTIGRRRVACGCRVRLRRLQPGGRQVTVPPSSEVLNHAVGQSVRRAAYHRMIIELVSEGRLDRVWLKKLL